MWATSRLPDESPIAAAAMRAQERIMQYHMQRRAGGYTGSPSVSRRPARRTRTVAEVARLLEEATR
jgi:hypothetical protein